MKLGVLEEMFVKGAEAKGITVGDPLIEHPVCWDLDVLASEYESVGEAFVAGRGDEGDEVTEKELEEESRKLGAERDNILSHAEEQYGQAGSEFILAEDEDNFWIDLPEEDCKRLRRTQKVYRMEGKHSVLSYKSSGTDGDVSEHVTLSSKDGARLRRTDSVLGLDIEIRCSDSTFHMARSGGLHMMNLTPEAQEKLGVGPYDGDPAWKVLFRDTHSVFSKDTAYTAADARGVISAMFDFYKQGEDECLEK